ncbi:unnamed protein product [Bursaphelenchus xylophilus]|uniref:(pine wood nematode) hypothetical protein n=1 Tax=Bursaphelenchus xylophilus TaxID=6326 RepID=A0A1I7RZ84_BURXY|nr:unnamed protein product [Bursaphelenchus xylophilus]CAG9106748.1 unnamed protein product [Bursaphelenchus xylophilus]
MFRLASALRPCTSSIRQISTSKALSEGFGAVPKGFNQYKESTFDEDPAERPHRRPLPSVNRIELIGGVASDIRLNQTQNGKDIASFTVATNVEVRRVDGSLAEFTDFHNVTVFGPLVKFVQNNLQKGSRVVINGRLSYIGGVADELGNRTPKQAVITAELVQPLARITKRVE